MALEPGKVYTREDLKKQFNFQSYSGVDIFLDRLEEADVPEFKVMTLLDERVLVFNAVYWEQFLSYMREAGYWLDSTD